MLNQITETVRWCEERAREKTVQGVSSIKSLGLLHLGDQYVDLTFRSEKMFKSRRDALARQVDFEPELWDFFDINSLWERQEKMASTSMAVTVAGVVGGRMIGGVGWLDGALTATKIVGTTNLRKLFLPGLVLACKFLALLSRLHHADRVYSHIGRLIRSLPNSALPTTPTEHQARRSARCFGLYARQLPSHQHRGPTSPQIPSRQTARGPAAKHGTPPRTEEGDDEGAGGERGCSQVLWKPGARKQRHSRQSAACGSRRSCPWHCSQL